MSAAEGVVAMDELLDRLVAKVGIDRGVAEKAVGIILAFLLKEGPSDKVQALINQMPSGAGPSFRRQEVRGIWHGVASWGSAPELMAAGLAWIRCRALPAS